MSDSDFRTRASDPYPRLGAEMIELRIEVSRHVVADVPLFAGFSLMTSRILASIRAATIMILDQSAGLLIAFVKCLYRGQPTSSCSASIELPSVLSDIFPASFSNPAPDGWFYSSHTTCDTHHKVP